MVKLNRNDENVNNLIKYLQDTNPTARLVTYYALAEFVVPYILGVTNNENEAKQSVKETVWTINELAIIDKVLLERVFSTTLEYKLYNSSGFTVKNPKENVFTATCFQDVLGITRFYTAADIHAINTNFNLFIKVATEVLAIINKDRERLIALAK